jgi:hypothetical protein
MQRAWRIESWTSRHASTGWLISQKNNSALWSLQVHDFRNVPKFFLILLPIADCLVGYFACLCQCGQQRILLLVLLREMQLQLFCEYEPKQFIYSLFYCLVYQKSIYCLLVLVVMCQEENLILLRCHEQSNAHFCISINLLCQNHPKKP